MQAASAFDVICSSADREPWLAARMSGIGSSDAPAVLGVSPFKSAAMLYAEKRGLSVDQEESEAMKWGHILEPHILEQFGKESGRNVWGAGDLIRSCERPWQLATLDGEQREIGSAEIGNVEAKATSFRVGDWTDGVPHHVFVQAQHQLSVTERRLCSVVVLQFGCKLLWTDIERDDAFIDQVLIPAELEFWERVQNGDPPAPDGSKSAAEALARLYPKAIPGKVIQLPGALIEADDELLGLSGQIKELKDRKELLEQRIKEAIGDAEVGAFANGVSYTHKLQNRMGFEVKPTSFRTLRRVAAKGE